MLQSLSGSNVTQQTYLFSISDLSQVGEARRFALSLCGSLNFDEVRRGRVGIVVNELGNNLFKYAKNGSLLIRKFSVLGTRGIEILALDYGPGMNVSSVMKDGFTTGTTPGTGLGAARRLSDVFDIYSELGSGTAIVAQLFDTEALREKSSSYDVGVVNIPLEGESLAGDSWAVSTSDDKLRVLAVDGLGHGPLAHRAAQEAVEAFETSKQPQADGILREIHGRLKSTRGGAVFVLTANNKQVEFAGVGNIRAIIQTPQKTKTLISQNGTAGIQVRNIKNLSEPWEAGFLIFHSDGISSKWDIAVTPALLSKHPSIIAAVIFRDYTRKTDDSLVLVIKRS